MAISVVTQTEGSTQTDAPALVGGGGAQMQGLVVLISRLRDATVLANNHTQVLNVQLWELDGNDADYHRLLDERQLDVDDSTAGASDTMLPEAVLEDWVTFRFVPYDAADDMGTGWVEVRIRDILLVRLSPKHSVHRNSGALDCSVDIAAATASTWCGLAFCGSSYTTPTGTASGLQCRAFGGQIVRKSEASTQPINVGASDLVATYSGGIDCGTLLREQTLTTCTATGSGPTPVGRDVLMCPMLFTPPAAITDWPYPSPNAPRVYMFWMDGVNAGVVNPVEHTFGNWLNVSGTSTYGKCRVLSRQTWRDRMVFGNYEGNQSAWFMAKVGDPTNLTVGGSDPTRAFSGDGSNEIGTAGDAVTAFQVVSDSILFMGCAVRSYYFSGDPGVDGVLKEIPDKGGILGPRAICRATGGRIFGISADGLRMWRFGAGSGIESTLISNKRVNKILDRVSTLDTDLELVFEAATGMVHIFLHPRDGQQGTHLAFGIEANEFWPMQYPSTWGPARACEIAGESFDEKRIVMGLRTGLLVRPVTGDTSDDGAAILVRGGMPYVESEDGTRMTEVVEVEATAARGSGPVDFSIRGGRSAAELDEQDWDQDAALTEWTWFTGGKQSPRPIDPCCGAGAVQLCFEQESAVYTFALDRLTMKVQDGALRSD